MITNDQLERWTQPPSATAPAYTYDKVKDALKQVQTAHSLLTLGKDYDIYLQGSYANSTNTKGDSDVDIVIELHSVFRPNLDLLSVESKQAFHAIYPDATYSWAEFRNDVHQVLLRSFGPSRVTSGNKSLKIAKDGSMLNADVVPSLQYRKYLSFGTSNKEDFVPGIKFWTIQEGKEITNYPKVHKQNGENKNSISRTNEKYKDTVRIMKNMKSKLVESNAFHSKIAPSYFLESSVYNCPDNIFVPDRQSTVIGFFEFLRTCDTSKLKTVSHQHDLFGTEPWQWNLADARTFFGLAIDFFYKQ